MIIEYLFKSNNVTGLYKVYSGNYVPSENSATFEPIYTYYVIVDSNTLEISKEDYEILKEKHRHSLTVRRLDELTE